MPNKIIKYGTLPAVYIGTMNVNGNNIQNVNSTLGSLTGKEYVACEDNFLFDIYNGILFSGGKTGDYRIKRNFIQLAKAPNTTADYNFYGVCMQGGVGASTVEDNIALGSYEKDLDEDQPTQTGFLLELQTKTTLGCNKVNKTNHAFRFYGTCGETKWWDNEMNIGNQYGLTLDNGGIIGMQGLYNGRPGSTVCTNDNNWVSNQWDPSLNQYMTLCKKSDPKLSPLIVYQGNPLTSGLFLNPDGYGDVWPTSNLPYFNNYGLISAVSSPTGCVRCQSPVYFTRPIDIGLLEEIAQGVINLPNDDPEMRLYAMQQQLLELVKANPGLVANSADLQQFLLDNRLSSLDFINYTAQYLSKGDMAAVRTLLGIWSPQQPLDDLCYRYFDWVQKMAENPDYRPDTTEVAALANLCPVKGGTIVYALRNLYNSLTNSYHVFNNDCDAGQARGKKKDQGFVRLKQPKKKVELQPMPDAASPSKVLLFPNPSKGRISLSGPEIDKIIVANQMGNVVYEKSLFRQSRAEIDLSHLPKGYYSARVYEVSGKVSTLKLQLQ